MCVCVCVRACVRACVRVCVCVLTSWHFYRCYQLLQHTKEAGRGLARNVLPQMTCTDLCTQDPGAAMTGQTDTHTHNDKIPHTYSNKPDVLCQQIHLNPRVLGRSFYKLYNKHAHSDDDSQCSTLTYTVET